MFLAASLGDWAGACGVAGKSGVEVPCTMFLALSASALGPAGLGGALAQETNAAAMAASETNRISLRFPIVMPLFFRCVS